MSEISFGMTGIDRNDIFGLELTGMSWNVRR
jgi:hypothetical protein